MKSPLTDGSTAATPLSATDAVRPVRRTRRSTIVTASPDAPPPKLICPVCDVPLAYKETVIGGVQPIEQWHHFTCRQCGPFVYRDRTRQLRATT
jgi:hypothetical protein